MGNRPPAPSRQQQHRQVVLAVTDFPLYARMTPTDKILFRIVHWVDRRITFWRLPVALGLVYLEIRRGLHQRYSLLDVPERPDFSYANEGDHFFGRNMPTDYRNDEILDPHPTLVASKLLARKTLVDTGLQFNLLAASWIQFMIHDWVDHLEDATKVLDVEAPKDIVASCPLASYKFYASKEFPTRPNVNDINAGYRNIRTPEWDGSVIYGSHAEQTRRVRTFRDGKLKLSQSGGIVEFEGDDGPPVSGDVRNTWVGMIVLQSLFVSEHNAVCDMLQKHHPHFDDEELYQRAKLVTAATMAKIHTIDWTVELLKMDTLYVGMRANWYGLLGKTFKSIFGHTGSSVLSGFIGMPKPEDHGVPYSLTEEFVGVYRMHSLLPDSIAVREIKKPAQSGSGKTRVPPIAKEVGMAELVGSRTKAGLESIGNEELIVSMGHQACGALTLWNYPQWLRDLVPQDVDGRDRPDKVDLPSLEIYRDRERGVPRYNAFRRRLLLIPISTWDDLSDDADTVEALRQVYGDDVEKLDLLVGLMAERKPTGYAISETAFVIFLLMASRRLEANKKFTTDFNERVYTKEGLAWVNNTEGLKDVLARHHPEIVADWLNPGVSAFSVWASKPKPCNPIPIYFRIP